MVEQTFEDLKSKVKDKLEEKTIVDMILNHKQSIDDVVGTIPKTPNIDYASNIDDINKELSEFEKLYNGEPAKKGKKKVEGAIPGFLHKAGKYLFGGQEEEIIRPAVLGLEEEGRMIYQKGASSLESVMKELPKIKKGIRMQENYKVKLDKYLKEHANIFFTCDAKKKEITELIDEMQEKYDAPETSVSTKREISQYVNQLRQKEELINQTMRNIESRTIVYDQNRKYVSKQVNINKEQISFLETRIATNHANLESFKVQVETLPVNQQLIIAAKTLNHASGLMRNMGQRVHSTYMKSAELSREMLSNNPDMDMYSQEMLQDISSQDELLQDMSKLTADDMYTQAKSIFLNLD